MSVHAIIACSVGMSFARNHAPAASSGSVP